MIFNKRITECGAPLYVFEMPHAESVACGILVKAGSVDEKWPEEAGLAHAFEHMVFQGNERFKNSKRNAAYIEEIGGHVNAWTWKEMTFFHATTPKDDCARGFTWLYHLLSSPTFDQKNIETEMQNVVQEIKARNDDPAALSHDFFGETVYGAHPLARDVLGSVESVSSFTRENFLAYHEKFYYAQNFVFLAIGNIKTDHALGFINSHAWRAGRLSPIARPTRVVSPQRQVKILEKIDIEQVHAVIGTLIGYAHERGTRALQLFSVMVDGGSSFPLFQEVRDKRGLCYSVSASVTPWTDCGVFSVYVGTDPQRYVEAILTIEQVLKKSASDERLFKKAKRLLKGSIALRHEHPDGILTGAAMDVVFHGKPMSPEETIQEIESITFEEVKSACARYLNQKNFTEIYVAPKGFVSNWGLPEEFQR